MQHDEGRETRTSLALRTLAAAIVESLWQREVQLPDGDGPPDADMQRRRRNPVPHSNTPTRAEVDDGRQRHS
jgi:hypothetical protein